jgi:hypothetical protein
MKTVTIVANVAQLAAILLIFFIRGLDLGTLVLFLLFFLMAVPFINFLSLFFAHRFLPETASQQPPKNGIVKREAMRIHYREDHCPILKTDLGAFIVRNLSEGGVSISAASTTPFKKRIDGQIQLLCGDRVRFNASVLRKDEGEVVFGFSTPIGTAILMEEKKMVALGPMG